MSEEQQRQQREQEKMWSGVGSKEKKTLLGLGMGFWLFVMLPYLVLSGLYLYFKHLPLISGAQ